MANTTQLENREGRWRCPHCGRWAWANSGKLIAHSTRCDFQDLQPETATIPTCHQHHTARRIAESKAYRERKAREEQARASGDPTLVHNEFGYGSKATRVGLDTDY